MYLIVPMVILLLGSTTVMVGVLKFDALGRLGLVGETNPSTRSVTIRAPEPLKKSIQDKLREEMPRLKDKCSRIDLGVYLGRDNLDLFYRHVKQAYVDALLEDFERRGDLPQGRQLTRLGNRMPGRVIQQSLESLNSSHQRQHDEVFGDAINHLEGARLSRVHDFVTRGGPSLEHLDHERGLEFLGLVIQGIRQLDPDRLDKLHFLWERALKE